MTLLLPELERQLRAVVRSGRMAEQPRARRRIPLSPIVTFACLAGTLAIAAIVALDLRPASRGVGRSGAGNGVTTRTLTDQMPRGTWCGEPLALRDVRRRLAVLARGPGSAWLLTRVRVSLPRIGTFTTPALDLGGRLLLACDVGAPIITQIPGTTVFWTLNGDPPGQAGRDTLQIRGVPAMAITRRRVEDGTFFLAVLPRSECRARSLIVRLRSVASTTTETITPMPKCLSVAEPPIAGVRAPAGLSPAHAAEFRRGEAVLEQSGCLACHQLAGSGNNGPGPPLTAIGSRLTRAQLAHFLRHPAAPMPSFAGLERQSPRKWAALLYFLSHLGQ